MRLPRVNTGGEVSGMAAPSGMATLGDPFVHPALFYRDDDTYLGGTVPYITEGLTAGEPVAVAVPRTRLGLLRDALGGRAAHVRMIDMEQAGRNPGRIIPRILRAFADAHPGKRVRIIGEPIWAGRSRAEYGPCVQHEALINKAFAGRQATILCPYDSGRLDAQVISDAYATHPVLIEGAVQRASTQYAPDRTMAAYNVPLPHPADSAAFVFGAQLLPDVRHFALQLAANLGLPEDRREDLAMAVAELTTNSVIHGGGSGVLRLWAEGDDILCQVEDCGQLSDPLAGRFLPPPGQPGGRGLVLVNYLTDLVRVHTTSTGTTIRCHLGRAPVTW
jgi:anti-sigma regulatory factor (Ser/Thr protein kinase)